MRINPVVLFISVVIFSSCSAIKPQNDFHITNKELLASYNNFDESFKKTRNILSFDKKHIANNCKTYIEMLSRHDVDETIHNQMVKSEYLVCDALKILSKSSESKVQNVHTTAKGEELLTKLDLRTFPSSLSRISNENTYTLKGLYPKHVSSNGSTALLETDDWVFTLEVVAIYNLNDNSIPDLIVWVLDESKSGNYRGYSTLIIYDPNQDIYRATPYSTILTKK